MESTFENILENWTNGNRSDVRKMVDTLTSNEKYMFNNWLKHHFTSEDFDRSDLFNLVCFIAFA